MQKKATNRPGYRAVNSIEDRQHLMRSLAQKHFGESASWSDSVHEFLSDIHSHLRHGLGALQNQESIDSQVPPHVAQQKNENTALMNENSGADVATHDADEYSTLRSLKSLIVRLRQNDDGSIVYLLREGKLAGEETTLSVRDKDVREFLDPDVLDQVLPHILEAFAGNSVQYEYVVKGRCYLRFFAPILDEHSSEITEVVGSLTDITEQKEVEAQLRSSEHLFRKLIDSIPIGILKQEIHPDTKVHDEVANAEFQRISGYSVDELWAMSPESRLELIHPDQREDVVARWSGWVSDTGEDTLNLCYQFQHRNGEYRTFQNYMVKFQSEAGNLVCVQAVLDITERDQSDKRLRHLASFPEQSITPIFEIGEQGDIHYMNAAAAEAFVSLLKLGAKHPVMMNFDEVMRQLHESSTRVFKRSIMVDSEYFEQHVYYMPEAQVYRVFCHNISTMKRAEDELRESLEKERALSLLRSTFIDTVSHEFRTPLTGINTSAELLKRYDGAMTHDERVMHIDAIRSRVQDIVDLVSRFTTQSSLRNMRDSYSPCPLDLNTAVLKILEELRSLSTDRKQTLSYMLPEKTLTILGDERLFRHALRNILLNAMQYSADGTMVQLRMNALSDCVKITVIDQGVGIPERDLELLYTPFFRGTNVGTSPGSGLGISIAKEFIDLHKGKVEIQSRVGIGTTVVVTLPLLNQEIRDTDALEIDAQDA